MDKNRTISNVIRQNNITNARELTTFLLGDESKGILTPYPKGYGKQLWKEKIKELRGFYDSVLKENSSKKQKRRNKKHQKTSNWPEPHLTVHPIEGLWD